VTQADLDRATFRVGLQSVPRKRRVTILLDTGLVEYFKAEAGERGYQTLINETLRRPWSATIWKRDCGASSVKRCRAKVRRQALDYELQSERPRDAAGEARAGCGR
jgi:hypothetical protein